MKELGLIVILLLLLIKSSFALTNATPVNPDDPVFALNPGLLNIFYSTVSLLMVDDNGNGVRCTGVKLSPHYIVTSAHCFRGGPFVASNQHEKPNLYITVFYPNSTTTFATYHNTVNHFGYLGLWRIAN